jgi:hypothetical protein
MEQPIENKGWKQLSIGTYSGALTGPYIEINQGANSIFLSPEGLKNLVESSTEILTYFKIE